MNPTPTMKQTYKRVCIGLSALCVAGGAWPAAGEDDAFRWSWEDESGSAEVAAAPADDAVATDQAAPAAGSADMDAYNRLLSENLALRRQLQESDRGAETIREENTRLRGEIAELESRIAESATRITELRDRQEAQNDPDEQVDLETRLAAAERERSELAGELAALRDRLQRGEAEVVVPAQKTVEAGSDLFVELERENAGLRERLQEIEAEKQKVIKQLREVEESAAAAGGLEQQIAEAQAEQVKHKEVIRLLLDKIPGLERDLADARTAVREKDRALSERDRELDTMRLELERREHRLKKAERILGLLVQAREDVQEADQQRTRDMHYNMGVMYTGRGKYSEAEKEYLCALRIDPADADSHFNLAVLYDDFLKEPQKAAVHYRRYLKLRPDAPDALEVQTWLIGAETR